MSQLTVGTRVRYIGGQSYYNNPVCLILIGHTGIIRSVSSHPDADWDVEMDEGCFDLDAKSCVLEPIDECDKDCEEHQLIGEFA